MKDQAKTKQALSPGTGYSKTEACRAWNGGLSLQPCEEFTTATRLRAGNSFASSIIKVSGINVAWNTEQGTCTFDGLPVAMMWVDTTLAGLMSGAQAMVGTVRFLLALQSEGL